jgi:predicted SnoaL-like aldol condensation-catalyzing enzyme
MKKNLLCVLMSACAALSAQAQVAVQDNPDHAQLLASKDPLLAANKRLVYDFQREVLEGGQLALASKYLADDYVQHNPNVPTGRDGFVQFFTGQLRAGAIAPRVKAPIVSLVAEGDLVVISYRAQVPDPANPGKPATTTWFDMFRVKDGKLAEHWDPMPKS